MKQYIWMIFAFACLTFCSCKESIEPFFSDNEQDRDADEITGDDYVYHIPVIFHVLYQDQNTVDTLGNRIQYIPYIRLKQLLDNVNDLYEGSLYNYSTNQENPSENIHVKFEMALCNEDGKNLSTPGVEYIKYTGEYPIDCNKFMNQKKGKNKIIWDPNEYVNVMVYNFKQTSSDGITLGISNMPYVANGYPQIEGLEDGKNKRLNKNNLSFEYCLSINSLYIYQESSRYEDEKNQKPWQTYNSADANVTLAHELGHYLGLHHTFAEQKNGNDTDAADNDDDTDYCTDTKSYNRIAYNKWLKEYYDAHKNPKDTLKLSELIQRSNSRGETWESDNFMDYSASLSFRFTPEQKERIRQVLYYSPLIPGPKKNRETNNTGTRSTESDEPIELPIQLAVDKATQPHRVTLYHP